MDKIFGDFFSLDFPGEVIISLCVISLLIILCFIIYFKVKHTDPLKEPKGIVSLCEIAVSKVDGLVEDNMGPSFDNFGGYILTVALFMGASILVSLTGLPNPLLYICVPLSLALITFILIHVTSIRYTKWKYFKRYVDPIPIFLPINLLSMWAPLLSLTLRLFGNMFAGYTLLAIAYWALGSLSSAIFSFLPDGVNSIFIAPFITPFLHAYFDVFSGAIQILVFMFLTMLFIAQEKPEDEKVEEQLALA